MDFWLNSDKPNDLHYLDCAVPTNLENKTWSFLQTRLKLILSSYKTTSEEDSKILANEELNPCMKLAIAMRLTEKNLLQMALNYTEQRIKN